jgi:hypothetical protein
MAVGRYLLVFCVCLLSSLPTYARRRAVAKPPDAIQYTSFQNATLTLQPVQGKNVTFLLPTTPGAYRPDVVRKIVDGVDKAFDYYAGAAGRTPSPAKTYRGTTTIAVVEQTCGAGCGYIGATGIELAKPYFDILYREVLERGEYDQVVFYELGRNFWFYGSQLTYTTPDGDVAATGFAIAMRFLSMRAAGVNGAPFGGRPFEEFRSTVEGLVDLYVANSTLTWANTLRAGVAPTNSMNLGGADFWASFLMRLSDVHGDAFVWQFLKESERLPGSTSTEQAVDSFVMSASRATKRNLAGVFRDLWRWPVTAATAEVLRQELGAESASAPYLRPMPEHSDAADTIFINADDSRVGEFIAPDGDTITVFGGTASQAMLVRKGTPGSSEADVASFDNQMRPSVVALRDGSTVTYDHSVTPVRVTIRTPYGQSFDSSLSNFEVTPPVDAGVESTSNVVVQVFERGCDGQLTLMDKAVVLGSIIPSVPLCSIQHFNSTNMGSGLYGITIPTQRVEPSNYRVVADAVCINMKEKLASVCQAKDKTFVENAAARAFIKQVLVATCPRFLLVPPPYGEIMAAACVVAVSTWSGLCTVASVCGSINLIARVEDAAARECWRDSKLTVQVSDLGQKGTIGSSQVNLLNLDGQTIPIFIERKKVKWKARVFNIDDQMTIKLNGQLLISKNICGDSGALELPLVAGDNRVEISLINLNSSPPRAVAWGYELMRDGIIVATDRCGSACSVGCNSNAEFPVGEVFRKEFVVNSCGDFRQTR